MKVVFNDLTELTIQDWGYVDSRLNIKTLTEPETLRTTFSDASKTRKMTIVDDDERETVIEGYTEMYSLEVYTGKIYGVNMYKPAETPEAQAQAYTDVLTLARIKALDLDDETALKVPNLFDAYDSDKDYERNDRVTDNGILYKALHNVTSEQMTGKTPSTAPTLWSKVLGESGTVEQWEQPESTNGYPDGAKVIHNGKIWESKQDNNVWEPGAVGAPWDEVSE